MYPSGCSSFSFSLGESWQVEKLKIRCAMWSSWQLRSRECFLKLLSQLCLSPVVHPGSVECGCCPWVSWLLGKMSGLQQNQKPGLLPLNITVVFVDLGVM